MSQTIDMPRLRLRLNELALEIRVFKRELRQPLRQITWQESGRLRSLKRQATELCAFRAYLRGKIHTPKITPEGLAVLVESLLVAFAPVVAPSGSSQQPGA